MFELKIPPLMLAGIIAVLMVTGFFVTNGWDVIDPVRIAAGVAIVLGGIAVWLGPLFYFMWINFLQIMPEERAMEQKFGPDYLDYKKQVRRWI